MSKLSEVLDVLDVQSTSTDKVDSFTGQNIYIPTNRTYGGQLLGQAIVAASRTTSEYRLPNSVHSYFLKPGKLDQPISYQVERLHDGVTFSHRQIRAYQAGERPIFQATVSFHEFEESAVDFSTEFPTNLPKPPEVRSFEQVFEKVKHANIWTQYFSKQMPFEIRQISSNLFLGADKEEESLAELVWLRIRPEDVGQLGDRLTSQVTRRALLAFASDQFAFSPALRAGHLNWLTKGAQYVSLDHTQYFHRDIDLTKWHLFVGTSPAGANARGVGITNVFNSDCDVVSTIVQEGLIRVKGNNDSSIRF
jgi:acyl-CoA thioesterase-2